MVGPDTSLVGGLVSAGTLLALNAGVSRAARAVPIFRRLAEGDPVVLVSDGHLLPSALRREEIEQVELEEALREHGVRSVADVSLAVLEVDGSISVVPKNQDVIRTRRRFRRTQRHH